MLTKNSGPTSRNSIIGTFKRRVAMMNVALATTTT